MGKVSNLIKGAGKNIAAAARTDGVMKAALKRTAIGTGIGAAAGGTMSAIQGGSFGEGAVRGGIMGGMAGAASSVYKMGAMGAQSIDSAGKFRKGATSVYSHLLKGNTTWDEVNKFRTKDADSFMNHIRAANDGQDLRARMIQMDGKAKAKNVGQIKNHSAGKIKRVKSQADTNPSTPRPEPPKPEVSPSPAPESKVASQVNTNPSTPAAEPAVVPTRHEAPTVTPTATPPETGTVNTGSVTASAPKMESPVVEKPTTKVNKPKGPDSDGWYTPDSMNYDDLYGGDLKELRGKVLFEPKDKKSVFAFKDKPDNFFQMFPGTKTINEDKMAWADRLTSEGFFEARGKGSKMRFKPADFYKNELSGNIELYKKGILEYFD